MNKKGFSLIELLVSIILVSVILISLLTTLVKIRQTYSVINENSDVLVYSSSISRVINNDFNKNMGINYINCYSDGTKCEIILGNDECRDLIIEETPKITVDSDIRKTNIKTTLKYIDTTKGNNKLLYIKTLELNKYENTTTRKITTEGYNLLSMVLDTKEYEDNLGEKSDVVTSIKINIFDGVNESNSNDYDITVYSSNRYALDEVKGKTFRIAFNNMEADQSGTMSMDEEYGVGFFKANSAHKKDDKITEVNIPVKLGYYFEGYFLKDETTTEKMVIDENGKIVASNKMFKRNISNRLEIPYVYAKWKSLNVTVTFDPAGGTLDSEDRTKTLLYNSAYGLLPIPEYKGYTHLGWFNSKGEEIKSSSIVKIQKAHTLYAHWELNTYSCNAGEYLPKGEETCAPCPAGSYCPVAGEYPYDPDEDQGKTKCPGSMTSEVGSTVLAQCKITCEAGKYLKANEGTCSSCPAGSYCPGRTCNYIVTSGTCGKTECAAGSFSPAGASVCTACPGGKATSGTGKTSCDVNCAPISGLNEWETPTWNNNVVSHICELKSCLAGYRKNGTVCAECGPGTYSPVNSTSCTTCPAGTYSNGSANSSCPNCPTGYKSNAGASSCTPKTINVTFMRNTSSSDTSSVTETFTYGVANQRFGWTTDGCSKYTDNCAQPTGSFGNWKQTGKSIDYWYDVNDTSKHYSTYSGVSDSWINNNAPSITLKAHWRDSKSTVYYRVRTDCSSLVYHTTITSAFGAHAVGENNYWKLSNGSTYAHLWYRGTQYTNIVYRSVNSESNFSVYTASLTYSTTYDSGLGLTDIGVGSNQYLYIKINSGWTVPNGSQWKCLGPSCARSTYDISTNYTGGQLCNSTNGDCAIILEPNCKKS